MPCHAQRPFCPEFSRIKEPLDAEVYRASAASQHHAAPHAHGDIVAIPARSNKLEQQSGVPGVHAAASSRGCATAPVLRTARAKRRHSRHRSACSNLRPLRVSTGPTAQSRAVRTRFRSESISMAVCALELYRPQSNAICICQAHSKHGLRTVPVQGASPLRRARWKQISPMTRGHRPQRMVSGY